MHHPPVQLLEEVFPGTSDMARRMRELDWSETSLGPVERWPQSLRTSVSTCLDCAFPIILWWGPDLAILYNDEYRPMLGPKHPAALGQPGAKVWAEIWDVIRPMLSQVMERAEPTRSRDLLLHIDRGYPEEAYFSFSYSPIHAENGKVGGVFCPVIETTDKVIGERRLRTLRDLAATGKGAKSEAAAYQSAAAVLTTNPQDVPFALIYRVDEQRSSAALVASSGIESGTPASPEQVALDESLASIWSLAEVARSGRANVVSALPEAFPSLPTGAWKVAPQNAIVLPVLLPGQDQPRAILVAAVSPMRALDDDYRTFYGLVATQIASAVADAQALEDERRRVDALAELDRAKTTFFSNVSHEFRTPLTLMIGSLEELLTGQDELQTRGAVELLDVAHRNSLRLLKLVNTLLDFSRIEAGRMEAAYEPTELGAVTAELASVFRSAIEKAGLHLVVDCPPMPEFVYVDRDMWEKVVLNLLSNALKFTFEGEVAVTLRWHQDRAELTVTDTGIGISEQDLPRMFQRFHQVRNARSRTHEGSGIGLALVHELVRLHSGTVAVRSREGHGTTFIVNVPAGTAHLPADRIASSPRAASPSGAVPYAEEALRWLPAEGPTVERLKAGYQTASGTPARLLIADDNADMRDYLQRLFSQSYQVDVVADGRAALERIRTNPPDLVLADVMMPELDGFGLLAAIRGDATHRSIPVTLLSARAGEEARIEGLRAGADEYLVKPFSARELLACVASQLQLSRFRRETEQELRYRSEQYEGLLLKLGESESRLREADRRKDEFLALLAHELRNPLAPIRTGLELIRLAGDTPHAVGRVRMMMERQVDQMVRLIDDLLDVSRITSGKIVLQRSPRSLAELVQMAVEAQAPAIAARDIRLTVRLPEVPCTLDVDATRFVQVLSNVLHNATKFTPREGRIELAIDVVEAAPPHPARAVITVADSGVGIHPDSLPHVFQLFHQSGQQEPAHGGLGIGLALARRLVEMHDGEITAHSEGPGTGSTFVITLPVCEAPIEAPTLPRATTTREVRSRVVIIDDNRDAATTMAILVEELGGSARTAHDAANGLMTVKEFHPDVVFMDIGMPGMDGYEACRRIRKQRSLKNVFMVAVTGWGQSQDKQRAVEAGFDAHLTKPVDLAALESLLVERTTNPRTPSARSSRKRPRAETTS